MPSSSTVDAADADDSVENEENAEEALEEVVVKDALGLAADVPAEHDDVGAEPDGRVAGAWLYCAQVGGKRHSGTASIGQDLPGIVAAALAQAAVGPLIDSENYLDVLLLGTPIFLAGERPVFPLQGCAKGDPAL